MRRCLAALGLAGAMSAAGAAVVDEATRDEVRRVVIDAGQGGSLQAIASYDGCSCDEGGACTQQLAVRAGSPHHLARPLWLVRVDGVLRLSRYTRWQLEADRLDRDYRRRYAQAAPPQKASVLETYLAQHRATLQAMPAYVPAPR